MDSNVAVSGMEKCQTVGGPQMPQKGAALMAGISQDKKRNSGYEFNIYIYMSVRNNARNEQSEIMNEIKKNEPPDAAITSGEVQGNLRHAT